MFIKKTAICNFVDGNLIYKCSSKVFVVRDRSTKFPFHYFWSKKWKQQLTKKLANEADTDPLFHRIIKVV